MRTFILIHEKARDLAKKVIDDTPLDGKMKVEIKKVGSKRSTAQNNLYHLWVNQIAKELGYNHDEMHQTLVQKFLQPEVLTVAGNLVTVWPSTTKLKVAEWRLKVKKLEDQPGVRIAPLISLMYVITILKQPYSAICQMNQTAWAKSLTI